MDEIDPTTRFHKSTIHNMKRRARFHHYDEPGTYLVTLVVDGRKPLFGDIVHYPIPHVEYSELAMAIENQELAKMHAFYSNVELYSHVIMPDHIHMILHVNAPFLPKKHLGRVIYGFKTGCSRAWWKLNFGKTFIDPISDTFSSDCYNQDKDLPFLFEQGYNDRILMNDGQLDNWKRYLNDNPRRLSIKRLNPQFFNTIYDVTVAGHISQIYGNRFLLDIPDKMAVIVHHDDTDAMFQSRFEQWMACGERGGVLIGAAISPREKQVMRAAIDRGYRLIFVRENGFPPLFKPSGEQFDACADGRLLLISPWDYHFDRRTIRREQCLLLNRFAAAIVDDTTWY